MPNSRTSMLLTITACTALTSCDVFDDGKIDGRIESVGGKLGDWVLSKGTCYSGQRENYHGVLGLGPNEDGTSVKLVKDPTQGLSIVVNIPSTCDKAKKSSCRALVLKEGDCDVFKAMIERTNTTVNDVRKMNAHLRIDCKAGGGRLKGKLKYTGCH